MSASSRGATTAVEVAMVVAFETYCPATAGRPAVQIEEKVVATATGPEMLTRFPAEEPLVTGKVYVRSVDVLNGVVVRDAELVGSE